MSPSKSTKALVGQTHQGSNPLEGQTQSPQQGSLCSQGKGDLRLFLSLVAVFGQGCQNLGHCESSEELGPLIIPTLPMDVNFTSVQSKRFQNGGPQVGRTVWFALNCFKIVFMLRQCGYHLEKIK